MMQRPNDDLSDPMMVNAGTNNLQTSLLLDHNNNNNNNNTVDDPLCNTHTNSNGSTVWQCGSGTEGSSSNSSSTFWDNHTTMNPFTFWWNLIQTNLEECCCGSGIPKKGNDTKRMFPEDDSSEHMYHDTIPYHTDASEDDNSKFPKEPPTTTTSTTTPPTTTTTTVTNRWMSTNTYTIEVWNAIVTVLCLNVFMQFFTGKKK